MHFCKSYGLIRKQKKEKESEQKKDEGRWGTEPARAKSGPRPTQELTRIGTPSAPSPH
jgi:hypothetical protein